MKKIEMICKKHKKIILTVPLIVLATILIIKHLVQYTQVEDLHEGWAITEVGNLNGWDIYTLQDGEKKPLQQSQENGWEFSGLDFPGQVYYMSRVLGDKVNNPVIDIASAGFRVSVFIDNQPIYLHPYAAGAKIGDLYYTEEPIVTNISLDGLSVNLPAESGQTLTLAVQSLGYPEEELRTKITQTIPISFYNSLVDQVTINTSVGVSSAFPVGVLSTITILLLVLYLFFLIEGQSNYPILLLAVVSFGGALYYSFNLVSSQSDIFTLFYRNISVLSLLVFYAYYMPKKKRWFWAVPIIYALLNLVAFLQADAYSMPYIQLLHIVQSVSFIILVVCMALEARRKNLFFLWLSKIFIGALSVLLVLYIISFTVHGTLSQMIHEDITNILTDGIAMYLSNWAVLFFFFAGFILNFITFIQSIVNKDVAIKSLQVKNYYETRNVDQLKRGIDTTRRIRHEVFHHLDTLEFLYQSKKYEKLGTYIQQLTKERKLLEPLQYCNNSLVNAIVSERFELAKKHDIQTKYVLMVPKNINMKDHHLVSFLSNLLDNAIEATQVVEPIENRILTLKMAMNESGFLSIYCQNTKASIISMDSTGNIPSTKEDPGHGFGLQIMQEIAKKYHSTLVIENTESLFTIKTNLLLGTDEQLVKHAYQP